MNTILSEDKLIEPEGKLQGLSRLMVDHGIRPSYQRLRILEYLIENRIHPSADQIYHHLRNEIPTLSRTTVYSSLNSLVQNGLVRMLPLDENENRFDIDTHPHGHFKCSCCRKIFDFEYQPDGTFQTALNGFRIDSEFVLLTGVCDQCVNHCGSDQPDRQKIIQDSGEENG